MQENLTFKGKSLIEGDERIGEGEEGMEGEAWGEGEGGWYIKKTFSLYTIPSTYPAEFSGE